MPNLVFSENPLQSLEGNSSLHISLPGVDGECPVLLMCTSKITCGGGVHIWRLVKI